MGKCDAVGAVGTVGVVTLVIAVSVLSLKIWMILLPFLCFFDDFDKHFLFSIILWLDLCNCAEIWKKFYTLTELILLVFHDIHAIMPIFIFCWFGAPCITSSLAP